MRGFISASTSTLRPRHLAGARHAWLVVLALSGAATPAQVDDGKTQLAQLQAQLQSLWWITVEAERGQRIMRITGISLRGDGNFSVDLNYGILGGFLGRRGRPSFDNRNRQLATRRNGLGRGRSRSSSSPAQARKLARRVQTRALLLEPSRPVRGARSRSLSNAFPKRRFRSASRVQSKPGDRRHRSGWPRKRSRSTTRGLGGGPSPLT